VRKLLSLVCALAVGSVLCLGGPASEAGWRRGRARCCRPCAPSPCAQRVVEDLEERHLYFLQGLNWNYVGTFPTATHAHTAGQCFGRSPFLFPCASIFDTFLDPRTGPLLGPYYDVCPLRREGDPNPVYYLFYCEEGKWRGKGNFVNEQDAKDVGQCAGRAFASCPTPAECPGTYGPDRLPALRPQPATGGYPPRQPLYTVCTRNIENCDCAGPEWGPLQMPRVGCQPR
jgi:hypothetical protein